MADLVVVENFGAWKKSIKALDVNLHKELRAGLKEAGHIVGVDAASIAESKFKHNTAKGIAALLRESGAVGIQANSVTVASKAKRPASPGNRPRNGGRSRYADQPFAYPAVWEYGGRGEGTTGPKAFLAPGLEKALPAVTEEFGKVLDETIRKAGFIGG